MSLKVAIVAPWFRSLAHVYGRMLADAGHEVTVISSPRHFEPGYDLVNELLISRGDHARVTAGRVREAGRCIRSSDFALIEETSDPIFWGLSRLARKSYLMIHDARPHDEASGFTARQRAMRAAL